jgi:integrase
LLAAAGDGALRDLLEAAMVTGARAGELVNATRSQFDSRTGAMTFNGKTGNRTVPLSPPALALFKRLAQGKLPGARLLVRDDGRPWAHSDWDELVREAAAAAKLPSGTVLYTLRHSFVTQALTDGMATLDVARLVGTSIGMIEKHYGHLVASSAKERLARIRLL